MASSKGSTTALDFLKAVFLGTDPAFRTLGTLYISLHNADPTAAGDQHSHETAYDNYVRVAVAQTAGGWTVSGTQSQNAGQIQFAVCGVTGDTITHVAIGTANGPPATGQILYVGQLSGSLVVSTLVQPQFAIHALTITEA